MNLINKSTPEYSVSLYLILPTFMWRKKTTTYRKTQETSTKIEIPTIFSLTSEQNYFIVEISLVFGIGLKVITKEQD